MAQLLAALLLELIVVSPLVVIALNRPDPKWKHITLFALYYLGYSCLLFTPMLYPALSFIDSDWNWSGKLYAFGGSILFYILFRKLFAEHNFITFKQRNTSIKISLFITIIIFVAAVGAAMLSINSSATRSAYFLFQFTMPGLDEEIAYRGIMLGLLSNALRSKLYFRTINLGNPALLITSVLFGLTHSFHIDPDWSVHQDWYPFFNTFVMGLLVGWITLKSGSIVMSVLIHGLINTIPSIIIWSK